MMEGGFAGNVLFGMAAIGEALAVILILGGVVEFIRKVVKG